MKKIIIILISISMMILLCACGNKGTEETTKKKETTTVTQTTEKESETETETFRYSVNYTAVIDTSELTDKETSDMIADIREKAVENHMQTSLGSARYQELELVITCYYNDEPVPMNEVKSKLLEGLVIKSLQ